MPFNVSLLGSTGEAYTVASVVQLSSAAILILILILSVILSSLWSRNELSKPIKLDRRNLPRISIILPTWNEEKVIAAKLDDVESQDYPDDLLEVIIIDSASSDSTVSIVRNWISERTTDG